MAKLPDLMALGDRPKPEPMGRGFHLAEIHDARGRATEGLGQAIEGAGDAVFKIQEEVKRARDASQLSDVLGKAATELGEKTLTYQRDQDYKTSPQRFKAEADSIGAKYMGEIQTPLEREAFKREYGRLALSHHLNVLSGAAKQEGDANVAQLDSDLDVMSKSAANAQNHLEREAIINVARVRIAGNRHAGWITDVDAEKRLRIFESKLEHASVLRDINSDPKSVADKLATDPGYAPSLDPLSRQQLQHTALVRVQQKKSEVQPIEARQDAEAAMTVAPMSAEAKVQPASYNPEDVGSFAGDKRRLSDADRLTILRNQLSDQYRDPTAEGELKKEIAALEKKVGPDAPAAAALGQAPTQKERITSTDVRANLGRWVANAEAAAEKRHPGDPVYRDLVVGRVKNYVGTVVAAQEGEQRLAYTNLMGVLGGVNGKKPLTQDELFAVPGARQQYATLEPQQQAAILTHINHNANEATGKPATVSAKLVNQIFPRLFLPPDDPKAIYQPQQLAQFVSQGLTPDDHTRLLRKIEERKNPDGKGFASDVEKVNRTAHAMLARSIIGSIQPDLAEEGAYRFRRALDQKIEEYRAAKKDPSSLLTPGQPDYMLSPERVGAFMPNSRQATADAAGKIKDADAPPPVEKMEKLDAKDPQKSFANMKPGTWFVAPDGRVGRKPGAVKPTEPSPAPVYEGFP